MENPMALTQNESLVLGKVLSSGTATIQSPDQIDLLVQGMLKVSEATFNHVMDVVKEDRTLCKSIAKRMSDLADALIEGNNAATQSVLDTYQANSDAIRQFINNPTDANISISECFAELRYYAEQMYKIQQEARNVNQEATRRSAETNTVVLERNKRNRNIALGAGLTFGGAALLSGCLYLIKYINNK